MEAQMPNNRGYNYFVSILTIQSDNTHMVCC